MPNALTFPSRRLLAGATLLAALAGCDPLGSTAQVRTLEQAETRWRAANVTSYRYVHTLSCYCAFYGPAEVTVTAGRVTKAVARTPGVVDPVALRPPVDSLFAFIREQLATGPANLEVTYDPDLGYPRSIKWGTPANDAGGYVFADSLRRLP